MKRIAYSFLLVALLSCGSSSRLSNNHIRVEFRDSTREVFYLLAVRDSSLIVSRTMQISDYVIGAEVLPFARIEKIVRSADTTDGKLLAGILLGVAAGFGAPVLLGTLFRETGFIYLAIFTVPLGMLAGGIIGCNLRGSESEFDPKRSLDLNSLKALSRYPDTEPPELQKIK